MSLVIHHFCKDLRWRWPRGVVFLLALVFDFAVQMEWLWPMSDAPNISYPAALWSVPMWIIAWWVLLSVPPEEFGMAFRSTRPVSRLHHWLARILTGVVIVMLPAMIENAAVLLAYDRPWADVGRGVCETGIAVAVMMLWLLPAGTLYRGWEKYAALMLFVYFGWDGGSAWLFERLQMPYREAWRFMWYDSSLMLSCGACAGLVMLACGVLACTQADGPIAASGAAGGDGDDVDAASDVSRVSERAGGCEGCGAGEEAGARPRTACGCLSRRGERREAIRLS
jgi:hypothetical protein